MEKAQTTSVIDLFAVETIRGIDATSQDVLLTGTDQDDSWLVMGNINAGERLYGRNQSRVWKRRHPRLR